MTPTVQEPIWRIIRTRQGKWQKKRSLQLCVWCELNKLLRSRLETPWTQPFQSISVLWNIQIGCWKGIKVIRQTIVQTIWPGDTTCFVLPAWFMLRGLTWSLSGSTFQDHRKPLEKAKYDIKHNKHLLQLLLNKVLSGTLYNKWALMNAKLQWKFGGTVYYIRINIKRVNCEKCYYCKYHRN